MVIKLHLSPTYPGVGGASGFTLTGALGRHPGFGNCGGMGRGYIFRGRIDS